MVMLCYETEVAALGKQSGNQYSNYADTLPPHRTTPNGAAQEGNAPTWTILGQCCPRCGYPTQRVGQWCDPCMEDLCDWDREVNDIRTRRGLVPLPLPKYEPLTVFTPGTLS